MLWPHQSKSIRQVIELQSEGVQSICLTLPTGAGKTRVAQELAAAWLDADYTVSLYTNRKMLLDQISKSFQKYGIEHGIRASGKDSGHDCKMQISSIQTESSRVLRKKSRNIFPADRIIIDEAHLQKSDEAMAILHKHREANPGVKILGLTATPIDIGHMYDELIVGANNSECVAAGACVNCLHYGPDEPDLRHIKKAVYEFSENDVRKAMNLHTIWGRVHEWLLKLNPELKPTILFAPGVPESIWCAEQLVAKGIPAAHIDGASCWINGSFVENSRQQRDNILAMSKSGEIKVICNRFVLREGIDAPWISHGIFATIFSTLQSYLQSGGRLKRAYPGKDFATIQDHGGNWWKHGSLNTDFQWQKTDTEASIAWEREDRIRRQRKEKGDDESGEPFLCPNCKKVMKTKRCVCGFQIRARSRPVCGIDGQLREHAGSTVRERRVTKDTTLIDAWRRMVYRSKKAGRTFAAAEALFAMENGWYYPDRTWPMMPTNQDDFMRRVSDVDFSTLRRENGDATKGPA